MDLYHQLTPALLAFTGLQYQRMAPGVFDEQSLEYVQDHLRILSGFYGLLKPFDGIVPYRLGMGGIVLKLKVLRICMNFGAVAWLMSSTVKISWF